MPHWLQLIILKKINEVSICYRQSYSTGRESLIPPIIIVLVPNEPIAGNKRKNEYIISVPGKILFKKATVFSQIILRNE
jgi:hypothetical protein